MGLRDDLLTWQEIRQLADLEALTPVLTPTKVLLTSMVAERPQITWPHQYHWFAKAVPTEPQAGSVIYARAAWGQRWRKDLLKRITQPSVLVSTFYDLMLQPKTVDAVLNGTNIRHWFAVQTMATHPHLTAMPLGVKHQMKPILQAGEIRAERDILCYGNFSYLRIGKAPDLVRKAVWDHFSAQPWVTATPINKENIAGYVSDLGRSKFVLSPPGLGYDCYRTYEAIAMGAIPIVKRQPPITDVGKRLPVLLVDDWSDVTPERLTAAWESRPFNAPNISLSLTYWRKQIATAAAACREGVLA